MPDRRDPESVEPPRLGPRYAVLGPLGAGSGGAVWRVADRLRDETVAVKLLPPGDGTREFELLARLQHPGTVRVLDNGYAANGQPWFSMDLCSGTPLGVAVAPCPPGRVAELLARLLEAVGFVHDRGWVHGDLKPDNVLADADAARITLLDFGLAMATDGATELRGTPGYIAPEVLDGATGVSIRSDLYAVGVMGHAALTGRLPFPAESVSPGLAADASVDVPAPLVDVLSSLLRHDPDLRPASAREAVAALEAAMGITLRDPCDAVARIAPTDPIGRDDALQSLARALSVGQRAIVHGGPGAGLSFLLRAVRGRLRTAGRSAQIVDLSGSADAAWRALELAVRGAGSSLPERPAARSDQTAAGSRQRLAVHRVRCVQAVRSAVEASDATWLIDCPDPDPLAARVLLEALAGCDAPAAVATQSARLEEVAGAIGGHDVLRVLLPPWSPRHVAAWLDHALGRIRDGDRLSQRLVEASGGAPGRVLGDVGALLRDGAVFSTDAAWEWNPAAVEDVFAQDLDATVREEGDPAEQAAALASILQGAIARGELRSGRRLADRALERMTTTRAAVLAPLWRIRGRIAALLGEHADAANWFRLHRESGVAETTDRARAALDEIRAHQEAGAFPEALSVLDAEASSIARAGDLELHFTAAQLRAVTLMRLGRYDDARTVAEAWLRDLGPTSSAHWRVAFEVNLANCDWHQGRHAAAAERCARVLDQVPDGEAALRATLLTTQGTALKRQGELDAAATCFEEAGPLYESVEDLLNAARVLNNLGVLRYMQGDWLAAIAAFDRFRDLVQRLGNVGETGSALNNLGSLYRDTGQLRRAEQRLEEALTLARRHGLARLEPMVLGNLAETAAVGGNVQRAEELFAETIAVSLRRGIVDEQIEAWRRLAQLRLDNRDLESASTAIARGRPLAEEAGSTHELTLLRGLAGIGRMRMGEEERGAGEAEAAVVALVAEGDELEAARMRLRIAEVLADLDRYNDAADLLDACEASFRSVSARPEIQRLESLRQFVVAATRNQFDQLASHYAALQELTLALSQEMDLSALLELILDRTLELVGFERGYVLLMDGSGEPALKASRLLTTEEIEKDVTGPSSSVTKQVIQTRRPLVALDIDDDDSLGKTASITAARLRSVICVPILRGDMLHGVIYVDSRSALGGSADERAALLTACADAASVAIENARLVEALKRKNDSLAILAHELRTPLHAMIGLATSLLDGSAGEGQALPVATQIKAQGRRMSTMINQVLSVARMEADKASWRRERVDPLELVVAARDTLFPMASQAGVTLDADVTDDAPELIGDPDRLVQVLVNLLGNAVKFSPTGGRARVHAEAAEDGALLIVVEDDGPGIPAERLAAIFEPFQQAGDPSMRRLGVGLGLAISRQIVLEHDGTLKASNRPEGGARFELRFPSADAAEKSEWAVDTDKLRRDRA